MALTDSEKERTRYFLGYGAVSPAAALNFGMPKSTQTGFLLELAMNNLMVVAEDRVRSILCTLDYIENALSSGVIDRLAARKVEGIELRDDEGDKLDHEYDRWADRLAEIFMVPRYPFSRRSRGHSAIGNVPVGA